jgi:hypothetical protein
MFISLPSSSLYLPHDASIAPWAREISNKHHQDGTVSCTGCEQLVSRCLRKHNQHAHCVNRIFRVGVSRSRCVAWRAGLGVRRCRCQLIHGDNRDDEEDEDDEGDEYVHELVDAGSTVKRNVRVCGFGADLWRAKVLLLGVSHQLGNYLEQATYL